MFQSINTTTNLAEGRHEEMLIRIYVFVCVNVERVREAVSRGSSNFANAYCANDIGTPLVSTRTCFLWYVILPSQLCRISLPTQDGAEGRVAGPQGQTEAACRRVLEGRGRLARASTAGGARLEVERAFPGARDDGLSRCVADVPR